MQGRGGKQFLLYHYVFFYELLKLFTLSHIDRLVAAMNLDFHDWTTQWHNPTAVAAAGSTHELPRHTPL